MIKDVVKNFKIKGEFLKFHPYGEGHINDTYAVYFVHEGLEFRVLLQRINHHIFKDIEGLMNNIEYVTAFVKEELIREGKDASRQTLNLIKTIDNQNYYYDLKDDSYYRVYIFVEDTVTYQSVNNNEVFYECGKAFGKFQRYLAKFDASKLTDSIPDFHNTPKRLENFCETVKKDPCGRASSVQKEIDFVLKRQADCKIVYDLLMQGLLPLHVTHNDTKLNNILMDPITNEGICVVDLDTIMQGTVLYDIGDSLRFGCNTASEDEVDLSKVHFDEDKFEAYIKGFIEETKDSLNSYEKEYMAFSAKLLTLECGMRFLTDHIDGDHYFKIHRENHNLDRARTQFKLIEEIEQKLDLLNKIVKKYL